jgi:uncharacterized protein (DUF2235 family)
MGEQLGSIAIAARINANSIMEMYDSKLSVHFRGLFHQVFSVGSLASLASQSVDARSIVFQQTRTSSLTESARQRYVI